MGNATSARSMAGRQLDPDTFTGPCLRTAKGFGGRSPELSRTQLGQFLDHQPSLNSVSILCNADGRSIGEVSKNARSLSIVAMNSSRMRLLSFLDEVRYRSRTDANNSCFAILLMPAPRDRLRIFGSILIEATTFVEYRFG